MSDGRRAWSWCHAFCQSDLPSTTKHVLHTLHMFMNSLGESCFPSVDEIVTYSGLSKRSVIEHLKLARDAGWIESKQHGYRGRKWRRQEYVPRWPERDLTASCPPDDIADEAPGRGAGAAPRRQKKVVQELHQGGAGAAPEVVQEGNHVIENNPVTNPDTNPIERDGARDRHEKGDVETVTRDTWLRRLRKAHKDWPTYLSDSHDTAETEWFVLSEEDRQKAADLMPVVIAEVKKSGRTKFCAFAVYLREKRWERLPEQSITNSSHAKNVAAPFGKMWGAVRFAELMREPERPKTPPSTFQRQMIEQGGAAAQQILLERQARYGWPKINGMQDRAIRHHKGVPVDPALEPLADLFGKVHRGSELWDAWKVLHTEKGWPWLEAQGGAPEWVWLPDPPCEADTYDSAAEAVRVAIARFEKQYASITERQAAE